MDGYGTSLEHVLAALERLDLLLRVQVWRARQRHGDTGEDLGAFYIPEAEADALLDKAIGTPTWATVPLPPSCGRPSRRGWTGWRPTWPGTRPGACAGVCRCGWSSWPACST